MLIEECRESDLAALDEVMPSGGSHAAHFAGPGTYLVAWQGDQPAGVCVINWPKRVAAYPDCVEINHLHVRAEFRGEGVGTALIAESERRIRDRGHARSGLGVGLDNPAAARLYERLGYVRTGIVTLSEYTYVDADGIKRDAAERDEFLVKELRAE